ncbi:MAG: hypothetical protein AAGB22_05270, partial [Bacteroidota bacterium]
NSTCNRWKTSSFQAKSTTMESDIISALWPQLLGYLSTLDWTYIFTFIWVAYGINHYTFREKLTEWGLKLATRYRVLIAGVLIGAISYLLGEPSAHRAWTLVQSMVFAMLFHKFFLDHALAALLPSAWRKHLKKADE